MQNKLTDAPAVNYARVAPLITRIGIVTLIVGAVGTLGVIWPLMRATVFGLASLLGPRGPHVGTLVILLVRFLLGVGFPLLVFYAIRLLVQTSRGGEAVVAAEDNLRKMRRILIACLFLCVMSAAEALSMGVIREIIGDFRLQYGDRSGLLRVGMPTAMLYGFCGVMCAIACRDIRRALAEYDLPRFFATRTIGFEVQTLAPAAALSLTPPPLPMPGMPPMAAMPAPMPALSDASAGDRDLRAMLSLLAAMGVVLYTLSLSGLLPQLTGLWDLIKLYFMAPAANLTGYPLGLSLFSYTASLFLHICGIFWIVWGITCIAIAPRARGVAIIVGWITLSLLLIGTVIGLYNFFWYGVDAYSPLEDSTSDRSLILRRMAMALVHPIVLLTLLHRTRTQRLFARGSEAGEI